MYEVGTPPVSEKDMGDFVMRELRKISQHVNSQTELLRLSKTNVAPQKPREGDIRLADGTNWNPGSGAGFYGYKGGSWHKFD